MGTSFTDWQGAIRVYAEMPDELEHHGIKGMAWGVRRYQNEDGSLTSLGREHYGIGSVKRTSARKMTRDFNSLDRGYANVEADRQRYARKTSKLARKGHRAERKGHKEKAEKLLKRALKYGQKAALSNKQKKAIEALQWKIIGKAAQRGYTTNSKPVTRMGLNKIGRAARAIPAVVGGAVGGALTGGLMGANAVKVDGQRVSITKRGNGRTNIVNYANANKYAEEERRRQRANSMKNVRR